jgi:hypothetical protein
VVLAMGCHVERSIRNLWCMLEVDIVIGYAMAERIWQEVYEHVIPQEDDGKSEFGSMFL